MPTPGRFLENLVTHIQRQLAPSGAVIKSPERLYRGRKQIGEIDVTIRGKFGAASVFIGIECRDRSGEGPPGLAWIQQLLGKKQLLRVDKLVAVSTTGFRAEAVEAAKEHGIDLLTATDQTFQLHDLRASL
jgi:hypothetical protein